MYSSYIISTLYNGNFVQLAPVHSVQFNEKKICLYFQGIYSHFLLIHSILCVTVVVLANIFKAKNIFHSFSYLPTTYLKYAENCS